MSGASCSVSTSSGLARTGRGSQPLETGAPVSGRVLAGRYRLQARLGQGGMAEVFDGHDERLGRSVAVKLLRPDMAANPEVRHRFEAEARSAAGLSHPNVVAVFDTGEDQGTPFIVMERLPGPTLADRLAAGPVHEGWVRGVAHDVLAALSAAHRAGLVHRDIKPGNILIDDDGRAKVADFGIAKTVEVMAGDTTGTGLLWGTPAYMAPERVEGGAATPQSDLYAVGAVLYEALAGARPFTGDSPLEVAQAVLRSQPLPLARARPGVDPKLAAVVEQALSKDPRRRPASAAEMAAALGPRSSGTSEGEGDGGRTRSLGPPGAVRAAAAHPSSPHRPRPGPRPSRVGHLGRVRLVVVGLLALFLLGMILTAIDRIDRNTGTPQQQALAGQLRELADRVRTGDGPRGPEAASRLESVAGEVEDGGGSKAASALQRDAAEWNRRRELSGTATREMTALLRQVPALQAGRGGGGRAPGTGG